MQFRLPNILSARGLDVRNIKLVIEYDGTNYCGWQIQRKTQNRRRKLKTIQETIERTLKKVLNEKVKLIASGRTDSGVHAASQVANFKTTSRIPAKNIQKALNSLLADDISILAAKDMPLDFHARYSCKSKTYRYLILNQGYPSVLLHNRCYLLPYRLVISRMRKAARVLVGRHNFKTFCASGSSAKNTIRTIKRITIKKTDNDSRFTNHDSLIFIDITADGFLYNMVRSIVGTLIEIGRGKMELESIHKILDSKKRDLVGPTAPAKGLCLLQVNY